jgi:hypothetical protein
VRARPSPEQIADDLAVEMRRRLRLEHSIQDDREAKLATLAHCRDHPIDWINDWVWVYDPRNQSPLPMWMPLNLWRPQEELVEWVMARYGRAEAGVVKKSRDMGFTWVMAAVAVWFWLFVPGSSFTFGSRKGKYVDKLGDLDAIFPRVRKIIERLPDWMLPEGFSHSQHDHYMRIKNPATGAIITGEIGDDMGRGGRSTMYVADEFAFLPRAQKARAAIGGNSDCAIYGSTSNGVGTVFHEMENSGHLPVHYMYWQDHPWRDQAWADKKKTDIGAVNFAKEYEMDDGAAVDDLLIPAKWVMAAVNLPLEFGSTTEAGLDVAERGDDQSVYASRKGPCAMRLETWSGKNTTQTARRAFRLASQDGADLLRFDAVGVGAGVRGTAESESTGGCEVAAIVGSRSATSTRYSDDPRQPAKERFKNLATELWWAMRQRFKKTYEHVNDIKQHPEDELVSIPDDHELIGQLSSRKYEEMEAGKIRAEPKKAMKRRGIKSPDKAEALIYAFADCIRPVTVSMDDVEAGAFGSNPLGANDF